MKKSYKKPVVVNDNKEAVDSKKEETTIFDFFHDDEVYFENGVPQF